MSGATLREFLEGRRGGGAGRAVRAGLAPLGWLWGAAMAARAGAFHRGWRRSFRASVPVISVGNLAAGGTGKTPMTALVCRLLLELGRRPAILVRGYGAADPGEADEARWYARRLPGVPVFAGADRVASAEAAARAGADRLVLDDGFQHLRLRRDLDLVLLDAACPWSGGRPLPAGLLREFPSALARAQGLVLTRCDEAEDSAATERELRDRCPTAFLLRARHEPVRLAALDGAAWPLETLRGRKIIAACGIARPDSFVRTLARLGAEVAETLAFSDHHAFSPADAHRILARSAAAGATAIVTEKDAEKLAAVLPPEDTGRILALGVEMRLETEAPLRDALARL